MMNHATESLSLGLLQAQQGYGWHMHDGGYMFGNSYGWGFGLVHTVLWLLILAAMVAVALFIARNFGGKGSSSDKGPSALDRLDERYANGEIDREEYLQRKQDILER